ncbi:hypothetical protein CI109_104396 [Kwoniella shandongensis]|uniref:Uncharacterized protein n=1 Tax=Kwoniella shandongensis TaxID=1734106 RepID=A0A5M6C034_9TREE|nr:uncharacterized protein CI109_004205 [Kwoniella shandongensis]KAA5527392.1 hypothetical protein CI109_004205 [Kwoniella shandongensis]
MWASSTAYCSSSSSSELLYTPPYRPGIFQGLVFNVQRTCKEADLASRQIQIAAMKRLILDNGGTIANSPDLPNVNFILVRLRGPSTDRCYRTITVRPNNILTVPQEVLRREGWAYWQILQAFGTIVDDQGVLLKRGSAKVMGWDWAMQCLSEGRLIIGQEASVLWEVKGRYDRSNRRDRTINPSPTSGVYAMLSRPPIFPFHTPTGPSSFRPLPPPLLPPQRAAVFEAPTNHPQISAHIPGRSSCYVPRDRAPSHSIVPPASQQPIPSVLPTKSATLTKISPSAAKPISLAQGSTELPCTSLKQPPQPSVTPPLPPPPEPDQATQCLRPETYTDTESTHQPNEDHSGIQLVVGDLELTDDDLVDLFSESDDSESMPPSRVEHTATPAKAKATPKVIPIIDLTMSDDDDEDNAGTIDPDQRFASPSPYSSPPPQHRSPRRERCDMAYNAPGRIEDTSIQRTSPAPPVPEVTMTAGVDTATPDCPNNCGPIWSEDDNEDDDDYLDQMLAPSSLSPFCMALLCPRLRRSGRGDEVRNNEGEMSGTNRQHNSPCSSPLSPPPPTQKDDLAAPVRSHTPASPNDFAHAHEGEASRPIVSTTTTTLSSSQRLPLFMQRPQPNFSVATNDLQMYRSRASTLTRTESLTPPLSMLLTPLGTTYTDLSFAPDRNGSGGVSEINEHMDQDKERSESPESLIICDMPSPVIRPVPISKHRAAGPGTKRKIRVSKSKSSSFLGGNIPDRIKILAKAKWENEKGAKLPLRAIFRQLEKKHGTSYDSWKKLMYGPRRAVYAPHFKREIERLKERDAHSRRVPGVTPLSISSLEHGNTTVGEDVRKEETAQKMDEHEEDVRMQDEQDEERSAEKGGDPSEWGGYESEEGQGQQHENESDSEDEIPLALALRRRAL